VVAGGEMRRNLDASEAGLPNAVARAETWFGHRKYHAARQRRITYAPH